MPTIEHFLVGCVGAAVAYGYTMWRRIDDGYLERRYGIRYILFGALTYIPSGGAVAMWLIRPEWSGGAFMAGAGWEKIINGVVGGRRFPRDEVDVEGMDDQA